MDIILGTLSILGVLIISSGLYIFHNIFIEIMPFSFKNKIKEGLFFFFAYFGLAIFTLSWGMFYYLFYLYFDCIFSLNFTACFFALFFMLSLLLSFGIFFIDAINYQFMLESYWEKESEILFLVSKIFGFMFFVASVFFNFCLIYSAIFNFLILPFLSIFSIIFSILYSIWLISFAYNFTFKQSIFLI